MKVITRNLRGCIASLALGLNTALAALPLFFISLLKLIVPIKSWRLVCSGLLNRIAEFWINCNEIWLPAPEKIVWNNFSPDSLRDDETCFVTSNHQTYADIFLVQYLLNQRIPQLKFFLKQELIWIPVIGLCWWALDFPFMKRYSKSYLKKHPDKKGKDQQTTLKACGKFREVPVAIFNFMEGTRFTREKHSRQGSPYTFLLKPKAGGAGLVFSALGEQINYLLDITVFYGNKPPGFWGLLCGDNGDVSIHVEKKEIPARLLNRDYGKDNEFRTELLHWINNIWAEKDKLLGELDKVTHRETEKITTEKPETGENPDEPEAKE